MAQIGPRGGGGGGGGGWSFPNFSCAADNSLEPHSENAWSRVKNTFNRFEQWQRTPLAFWTGKILTHVC